MEEPKYYHIIVSLHKNKALCGADPFGYFLSIEEYGDTNNEWYKNWTKDKMQLCSECKKKIPIHLLMEL